MIAHAFVGLALGLAGCVERDPAASRWAAQLAELRALPDEVARGVTSALTSATLRFEDDAEPGIAPDGTILLPTDWRNLSYSPEVLARVAHLARHRALGVPPDGLGGCPAWRGQMLALELDGLAVEASVLAASGRPQSSATLAREVATRVDIYRRRCPG